MKQEEIYQAKQEWLEKVMGSGFTHATKTFAFCIFKRMYGIKTDCYPTSEMIKADGGFTTHSKFKSYRDALVSAGAIKATKQRSGNGQWENYTYALNLEWQGEATPVASNHEPIGNTTMNPLGTDHEPCGYTTMDPEGSLILQVNTTSNTSREYNNQHLTAFDAAKEDEIKPETVTPSFDQNKGSGVSILEGLESIKAYYDEKAVADRKRLKEKAMNLEGSRWEDDDSW